MVIWGSKFLAKFGNMITNDYGIEVRPIIASNPRANAIAERVHQTIDTILRPFKAQNMVLDDKNPWDSILVSTILALRATAHTTTYYAPAQLVFGCNLILNWRHDVDGEAIRKQK